MGRACPRANSEVRDQLRKEACSSEAAARPWETGPGSSVFLENGFYLFDLYLIICKMKD